MNCYAAALGNCSSTQTIEHWLSAGVLRAIGSNPIVEGWPGVEETKRISIPSLGSKILCDNHNTALSPLDACAETFFSTLQRFDRELANCKTPVVSERVAIEGPLLERWLLKIAFGLAAVNAKEQTTLPVRDQDRMLGVLFASDPWPDHWGLYVPSKPGNSFLAPADLAVTTHVHPESHEVLLLRAWCRFLPLHLAFGKPDGTELTPRPGQIQLNRLGSHGIKRLVLKWYGGAGAPVRYTRSAEVTGWGSLP